MKYIVLSLLGIVFFVGCDKEEYNVNVPMSDIQLVEPIEGASIDLNNIEAEEYVFTWDKELENGAVLILGTTEDLKQQVQIDAGNSNTFALSVIDADFYFSQLGLEPGEESILYWTVKEKPAYDAAFEVRTITVKRIAQNLIYPENQALVELSAENEDSEVLFEWSTEGQNEHSKYKLILSLDPKMKTNVWSYDIPNSNGNISLTHVQLQEAIENMPIKRYDYNQFYWNVLVDDETYVARVAGEFKMREMMRFIDERGDEKNIYRVTRIYYSDGTSQVWLADNLRTYKYPNGSAIELSMFMNGLDSWDEAKRKAYGVYYHNKIRNKIAPSGWRLPLKSEFDKLFQEAALVEGQWNVLKDPDFYTSVIGGEHLNEWHLNLCSSGQWWVSSGLANYDAQYCYFLASDLDGTCVLHDGGAVLWTPNTDGASVRFVLDEN